MSEKSQNLYTGEESEQSEALNRLMLEMIKNQKSNNKQVIKMFLATVICYTLLLTAMVVGFFWYESQFEWVETVTTETITQEVSGSDSEINNVEGNLYKDQATHNQERSE